MTRSHKDNTEPDNTAPNDNTTPPDTTTQQLARLETLISDTRHACAALEVEARKIQVAVAMLPLHMIAAEQLARLSAIRELKLIAVERVNYLTRAMQRLY